MTASTVYKATVCRLYQNITCNKIYRILVLFLIATNINNLFQLVFQFEMQTNVPLNKISQIISFDSSECKNIQHPHSNTEFSFITVDFHLNGKSSCDNAVIAPSLGE